MTKTNRYTYQKDALGIPKSGYEQQHTDTIRLLAHPVTERATFRKSSWPKPKREKLGGTDSSLINLWRSIVVKLTGWAPGNRLHVGST